MWDAVKDGDLDTAVGLLKRKSDIQKRLLKLIESRRTEGNDYKVRSDIAYAYIELYESVVRERDAFVKIDNLQREEYEKAKEQMESLMTNCYSGFSGTRMTKTAEECLKCTDVLKGVQSPELMEIKSNILKKLFWGLLEETIESWDRKLLGKVDDTDEVYQYISVRLCAFDLDLNLDVVEKIFSLLCEHFSSHEAIDEQVRAVITTRFDSCWLQGSLQ